MELKLTKMVPRGGLIRQEATLRNAGPAHPCASWYRCILAQCDFAGAKEKKGERGQIYFPDQRTNKSVPFILGLKPNAPTSRTRYSACAIPSSASATPSKPATASRNTDDRLLGLSMICLLKWLFSTSRFRLFFENEPFSKGQGKGARNLK